jgi:hemerythrin-like domain-containing protein
VSATDLLREEHQVIRRVLRVLRGLSMMDEVPNAHLREILKFSQTFIDRCHQGKEEHCLFPCLETRGIPQEGGSIATMRMEHQLGRNLVRSIEDSLARYGEGKSSKRELLGLCREYVNLLEQHFLKEETGLFLMAGQVMHQEDDAATVSCFHEVDAKKIGVDVPRRMLAAAKKIEFAARR